MREPIDGTDDEGVTRRQLDTTRDDPATQIVEIVADLDDRSPTELTPVYRCIDGLVSDLFSSPPPPEADACIAFSYEGYRIRVRKDGSTVLRDLSA